MTARLDTTCPVCFSKNDGHSSVSDEEDSVPSDGDISMCIYCGTLSNYRAVGDSMKLEQVSDEELEELLKMPDIQRALAIGRALSSRING